MHNSVCVAVDGLVHSFLQLARSNVGEAERERDQRDKDRRDREPNTKSTKTPR